jgi:hypothetical protein
MRFGAFLLAAQFPGQDHTTVPRRRHRPPAANPTPASSWPPPQPPPVELAAQRGLPLLLGMHASDTDKAALIGHYNRVAGTTGWRAIPHPARPGHGRE